jgi:hypothetical protein
MKPCLFLVLIICGQLSGYSVFAQGNASVRQSPEWDKNLTIEQNIATQAVAFATHNEFSFLDEIAKTRQVIIIGEETHYDLSTSNVKMGMINKLKTKGFNSIALEGVSFLTSYVFANPEYKEFAKYVRIEYIWGMPDRHRACQPLLDMINNYEIKLWGIDTYLDNYDIFAAEIILNKYSGKEQTLFDIDWHRLKILWKHFIYRRDTAPLSNDEMVELMHIIDCISNETQHLIDQKGRLMDLKAVMQWIRNINTYFSYRTYVSDEISDHQKLVFRNRDSQMVENILWITENFPNERFTVWCANIHGAKDISQIVNPTTADPLRCLVYQAMGEGVFSKLGSKMYMLAISSCKDDYMKKEEEKGVLEQEIAKFTDNAPFAFINFEPLRFIKGFNKEFDCNAMIKMQGNWLFVFDGMYYIRDQKKDKVQFEKDKTPFEQMKSK